VKSLCAVLIAVAALLPAATAPQPAPPDGDLAMTVEPLASPAGANSAEPAMTTERGRTILSWVELAGTHTSLKFAERTGSGWTDVQTAASGDNFMVNSSDVPWLRRLADNSLVAAWLETDGPDPEAYTLQLSWSKDEGRTWSRPIKPHRDRVQTQHGFASLFQVRGAGLGLVWLDGRAIAPDAPEGAGNMALRAATFDAAGTPLKEVVVDARVCECCPTAAAQTADGVIVAYRNRSAGEVRDIYVSRFVNGRWTPPVAVHHDGWMIEGCPVNGPAISAQDRNVTVAWFTAKGGTGRTFLAFSRDAGRTFAAPVRVDDAGSLGRVGVELLRDGSAAVTWVESNEQRSSFMARRVDRTGRRGPAVRIGESSGTRIPRVARNGDELLFVWTETEGGAPRVRTARASVH
jgi:hypothetical protein